MKRKLAGVGFILTIANISAGFIGYCFQIVMGRMLAPADFALFTSIMAISTMFSSPFLAAFTVVSRNITLCVGRGDFEQLEIAYNRYVSNISILGAGLLFFAYFCKDYASQFIRNATGSQVLILVSITIVTAMGMLNNSFIQGLQKFKLIGTMSVLTVVLKLIIATLMIAIGLRADGALLGVLISGLCAFFIVYMNVFSGNRGAIKNKRVSNSPKLFSVNKTMPILVANLCILMMTQLDVVFVNNYFNDNVAGAYAAAAVLGKAILYLPSGFLIVMFPLVVKDSADGKKIHSHLLVSSFAVLVLCLGVSIFYYFFGGVIAAALFKNNVELIGEILSVYGFIMIPMALLIVAEYFLMALGKVVYAWLSLVFAPIQLAIIYYNHSSVQEILFVIGVAGTLLLVVGYCFLYRLLKV